MTTHQRLQKSLRNPARAARQAKKARRCSKFPGGQRPRAYLEYRVNVTSLSDVFFHVAPARTAHSHGPRDWSLSGD